MEKKEKGPVRGQRARSGRDKKNETTKEERQRERERR